MKLMFIQGGTRLKKDVLGNWYTDGNFNDNIWNRYKSYCDELTVVLRTEDKVYEKEYAANKFNKFNLSNVNLIPLVDLNRPITRNLDFKLKKEINKKIEAAVKYSDKVIIRSLTNYYTIEALKYCKKYNKEYLIEVTGDPFDSYWYHGDLKGKFVALPFYFSLKRNLKNAPYAVYVTNDFLQKRYPCYGFTLGCSDVEILKLDKKIYKNKIEHFNKMTKEDKIILGTTAWVNLKTKGQHDVIRALYGLKKEGINNFEYQLVGAGDPSYLNSLIKKYNLENEVKILGAKPHNEVFKWLDSVDVYIQPSYQEGLCRAIVEAMSRACPIIASSAGGNYELTDIIFKKGNIKQIKQKLKSIDKNFLITESKQSFNKAQKYSKENLDRKRNGFYIKFIKGEKNENE